MRYIEKISKDLSKLVTGVTDQSWHKTAFVYGLYASYVVLALAAMGAAFVKPDYISTIESVLQIYVALFLILRFNPITRDRVKFDAFDARVSFSAGVFLFISTALFGILARVLKKISPLNRVSSASDALQSASS
jgi:hypothetical protein